MTAMARRFKIEQKPLHLDERELKHSIGNGNFIFVGSSCDMWAWDVPDEWIKKVISHTRKHNNKYLFQSKNPLRFISFLNELSAENYIFCTTLESNRDYPCISGGDTVTWRSQAMYRLANAGYKTMVTIEPIMDFDIEEFIKMIKRCSPTQVNIGADSGNNHLLEPSKEKVLELISELEKFTKVIIKKNLGRILNG
jgi:DNA repair photolyase